MIKKLFNFWERSKEQKAARLAARLIKALDDLGRVKAANGEASAVSIYEFSHVEYLQLTDGYQHKFEINFDKNGKIVKK